MLFKNDLQRLWLVCSADGDPPAAPGGGTPAAPAAGGTTPPTPAAPAPAAPAAPAATETPPARTSLLGTEPPKEGEAPPAPAPAEPARFDTSAVKLPEGLTVAPETLGEIATILTKDGLSAEQRAQSLIDMHAKVLKEVAEGPQKIWDKITSDWHTEIANDKDIGSGDPKSPLKPDVMAASAQIIDKFGGPELRTALDITGAGNNPAIVRFMANLSKAFVEGKFIPAGGTAAAARTPAQAMYPDLPSSSTGA